MRIMHVYQKKKQLRHKNLVGGLLEVLAGVVLHDCGGGNALGGVALVDDLGQFLDGQSEVKELFDRDFCVAHLGLLETQHNVARQDLVRHHHGEDMLSLVENSTRGNRDVAKL